MNAGKICSIVYIDVYITVAWLASEQFGVMYWNAQEGVFVC